MLSLLLLSLLTLWVLAAVTAAGLCMAAGRADRAQLREQGPRLRLVRS